jgi:hypothetical protein
VSPTPTAPSAGGRASVTDAVSGSRSGSSSPATSAPSLDLSPPSTSAPSGSPGGGGGSGGSGTGTDLSETTPPVSGPSPGQGGPSLSGPPSPPSRSPPLLGGGSGLSPTGPPSTPSEPPFGGDGSFFAPAGPGGPSRPRRDVDLERGRNLFDADGPTSGTGGAAADRPLAPGFLAETIQTFETRGTVARTTPSQSFLEAQTSEFAPGTLPLASGGGEDFAAFVGFGGSDDGGGLELDFDGGDLL